MNLSLQSSLFAPVAASGDTLSSYYRLLSSVAASPVARSDSSLPSLPLHAGDVLEVHGSSNTGKSAVLLSCVLSCCLPASVNTFDLHGCGRSCVLIDCDGRLSVYRLQCMLEERCSKLWHRHWETAASIISPSSASAASDVISAASRCRRQAVSLLTELVLRRLRVIQVADEVELMSALLTVDRICEGEQSDQLSDQRRSTNEKQQRQQQMSNIAPYLHDRQRPMFHTRDEQPQPQGEQKQEYSALSHSRSIASLPLPHSSSHSASLVSRYSPVSPIHSLHNSPDPLTQARQGAHPTAAPHFSAQNADMSPFPPLSAATPPSSSSSSSSTVSVSDVISSLSSLCSSAPPPVELLLVDNIAAFHFQAKSADKSASASASSPASGSIAPTVYSNLTSTLRRLMFERQLAAVVSKPTLFASSAAALQSHWKHSEYLAPEYATSVRWRMMLRTTHQRRGTADGEEGRHKEAAAAAEEGDSESSAACECRIVSCKEESVNGVRQARNTVTFQSTLAHI